MVLRRVLQGGVEWRKVLVESDAGYVNRIGGIGQEEDTLLSYLYKNALSPAFGGKK